MKRLFVGFTSLILPIIFLNAFGSQPIKTSVSTVNLTEYYDYECPHCRRMNPVIDALKTEYPNLKVTYRVTPLLTPSSKDIARIALSEKHLNKNYWVQFHRRLMQFNKTPTALDAWRLAVDLGAKPDTLKSLIRSKNVQNQITENIKMANRYAVNGAIYFPIFVFSKDSKLSGDGQSIVLRGEEPYSLLSAIVLQLSNQDVQAVKNKKG